MTENAPADFYRTQENPGLWPYRGQVAAVGIGHSPTARRWDGQASTSIGAWAMVAIRNAIEDAGISPSDVDGLVLDRSTTTGAWWPEGDPLPEDVISQFQPGVEPFDGIAALSSEWILNNMPELDNVTFTMYGPGCMSNVICVASEAIGRGLANTVVLVKAWHNFPGRYYQGGANARPLVEGPAVWRNPWGVSAATGDGWTFQEYMAKYGKTHDMMAPFIVEEKKNGLMFPEGFFAQHRPDEVTVEDYVNARWIVEPMNLFDHDMPIHVAVAYVFTTAERAQDMAQTPVYIMNHGTTRPKFGLTQGLDNAEASTDSTGRKMLAGAGIAADDLSFENMYEGFTTFHNYFIEGLGYAGIQRGEALDLYAGDISITSDKPVSPSGGNQGGGRTRIWMHTDTIQQIQGRAGDRQIRVPAEIGISGGPMPQGGDFTIWSATPD
ncbi:MAG: hypothetical protein F4X26_04630 [Chloroflexi bacterium]|nr:hypothetical protein [Chloroflexota bacterium]